MKIHYELREVIQELIHDLERIDKYCSDGQMQKVEYEKAFLFRHLRQLKKEFEKARDKNG